MNKIVVIYKSKYGFTEQYAQWIAQELGAGLLQADQTKAAALKSYDAIIYGGGLYAGGVSGISLITKNFESIKHKALYLFTVGAADVTDQQNIDHIRGSISRLLTLEMLKAVQIFHLRGGLDYPKMSTIHRTMMGMMLKTVRKKPESGLQSEDKAFLETYGKKVDFSDRQTILPLVEAVKLGTK